MPREWKYSARRRNGQQKEGFIRKGVQPQSFNNNAGHIGPEGKIVGFIDIGTNSIRLILVRLNPNYSYSILREDKEVVRLGENVFKKNILEPNTMDRAVLVCKKLLEVAKGFSASELYAVATSAAREAQNHTVFLQRLQQEAGLDVKIISGREESRLIYLGISSGIHINHQMALFIDIGGGSTEIILGDQNEYYDLESLGLGAIRLTSLFLDKSIDSPISQRTYEKMKRYAQKKMVRFSERINKEKIDVAYGSSGTIINLAEIACKMFDHEIDRNHLVLRNKELQKVTETLCSLSLDKRKQVPGINSDRADIIIGGAVVLETFMDEFKLKELIVSYRDQRHGMLIDYLQKHKGFPQYQSMSVRESSVLRLCRLFNVNEAHAQVVQSLCLELFDKTKNLGLHNYGAFERELLQHSSLLHDIGNIISFRSHHLHSYYIIQNAELLGFNQEEIMLMANIVRFHRKKLPGRKEPSFQELDKNHQQIIYYLSFLLRLAEKLDRSHNHLVHHVDVSFLDKNTFKLILECVNGECDLEKWSILNDKKIFETVIHKKLVLEIVSMKGEKNEHVLLDKPL